jgi:adenosylcobinamide-phosphate synthase
MLFYSVEEICWMVAAAILVDLAIGDPRRLPHPVIWMGTAISALERRWRKHSDRPVWAKWKGVWLTTMITGGSMLVIFCGGWVLDRLNPWLGYGFQIWFISTTLAFKGLKQAAMKVYEPLVIGCLGEARVYLGYIVGRDTEKLGESDIVRGTVETVAENTVDAVVSPIIYALLGAAPLAMMYRAANTLDSMVGYKNEQYVWFGWASARWDDVLNYVPARCCGVMMILAATFVPGGSVKGAWRSIRTFAHLHPSPNSGIPESAVAGALGFELGGSNSYGGEISERARMGWPLRPLITMDILRSIQFLYAVAYGILAVLVGFVSVLYLV